MARLVILLTMPPQVREEYRARLAEKFPDLAIDVVPTPTEVDRALGRLETMARERGVAIGMATALPVSIERIGKWAKSVEGRGVLLVPITAVSRQTTESRRQSSDDRRRTTEDRD